MPSFADSIFLFILALLLFGPKKLPVLARELGKWMGEFRRASNEFKMQMDEELRASEQADRQKQIAAMEAAAPVPPPLHEPAEPEHPHLRKHASAAESDPTAIEPDPATGTSESFASTPSISADAPLQQDAASSSPAVSPSATVGSQDAVTVSSTADTTRPIPIATSGSLQMMPPATGLPTPRSGAPVRSNALTGLVDAIPEAPSNRPLHPPAPEAESVAHAD